MSAKSQRWWAKSRRWWSIVSAGYLVVLVFAIGYFVTSNTLEELGTGVHISFGVVLAAPLGVAFLWDRLRTVKALGLEIALSEATVDVPTLGDGALADAIADRQYFSGEDEILNQISKAVDAPDRQVLEINLRSRPYWWSTRLYLQSALLVDYSQVQCLVFVEGGASRRYVGTTKPRQVCEALAKDLPCLETIYQKLANDKLSIKDLIQQWVPSTFDGQSEEEAKSLVGGEKLRALLGPRLETTAVHRSEHEGGLLYYKILILGERFVPVLSDDRLERVVDADALARRWSLAALEHSLNLYWRQ